MGDLHAKPVLWGNSTNPNGNVLFDYANLNPITITVPSEPTHFPTNGNAPSVLDIAVNKSIAITPYVNNDLNSDQLPVSFEINNKIMIHTSTESKWNYKTANWTHFRHILNSYLLLTKALQQKII